VIRFATPSTEVPSIDLDLAWYQRHQLPDTR
jgi:hypothetical protein